MVFGDRLGLASVGKENIFSLPLTKFMTETPITKKKLAREKYSKFIYHNF
jgi:hypothetical protein